MKHQKIHLYFTCILGYIQFKNIQNSVSYLIFFVMTSCNEQCNTLLKWHKVSAILVFRNFMYIVAFFTHFDVRFIKTNQLVLKDIPAESSIRLKKLSSLLVVLLGKNIISFLSKFYYLLTMSFI